MLNTSYLKDQREGSVNAAIMFVVNKEGVKIKTVQQLKDQFETKGLFI